MYRYRYTTSRSEFARVRSGNVFGHRASLRPVIGDRLAGEPRSVSA